MCQSDNGEELLRRGLHDLMIRTLPFLAAEQAALVVNAAAEVCDDESYSNAATWLELYAAVAARNPGAMLKAGYAVLATPENIPAVMREYALAAVMLGAHSTRSNVQATWAEWSQRLYSDAQPPEYIRLLASVALEQSAESME